MKIVRAKDIINPEQQIDKGFEVYNEVMDGFAAPFPIRILPRDRGLFTPEETLLAFDDNMKEILGIALLQKVDLQKSASRFGAEAEKQLQAHFKTPDNAPVYEVGGIAVSPAARGQGIGAAFYAAAARLTNNRCTAVITEKNIESHKAAAKGGFNRVAGSQYLANFSVKGARPVFDPANGSHQEVAHIYAFGFKP